MSEVKKDEPSSHPQETPDASQSDPALIQAPQEPESQPQQPQTTTPTPSPPEATPSPDDRSELIARARSFLGSPQVQHQDVAAKRAFLADKGLNEPEIEDLLRQLPPQIPTIPPRTYPQPPPSNLPVLLLGLARLFSWLAGGSAVLLLIYHRILLPRISQTSLARHSLKSHHLSLLRRLTTFLSSLKESQSESLSVLPRSDQFKEPAPYSECGSLVVAIKIVTEKSKEPDFSQLPTVTALRCGIADMGKGKEGKDVNPATEELFRYLEGQIPWLLSENGLQYENQLWETLCTCPLFAKVELSSTSQENTESNSPTRWEYIPPATVDDPPLLKSLSALSSELPKDTKTRKSPFQHTLQSLSDFTGYISTQVYLPYRPPPLGLGLPNNADKTTLEEDLRREIRALKGLVLNR
ncbi:hypothetical protein GALMADRAFT_54422 [Galerina marginata CBS 339.88]|uniref:Peroxisomal membrane protein PEX14 n=1 Tax=Galerina marginata (strain CBS 339.88) TaxID=685588 RepID=A0A067TNH7_GALM3|nr:hypothetical protein GALMADRAFT_54422 [Galerina marginata CBS 339.88]